MSSYNDNINNYFLGEVSISGGDPISTTTKNNVGTDLANIISSSGLRARNLAVDSDFNSLSSINMLHFGAKDDTIDDRILFVSGAYNGTSSLLDNRLYLFNDLGGTLSTTPNNSTGNTNLTNQIFRRRSLDLPGITHTPQVPNWNIGREVYWTGCTDGNSLGLVQFSLGNNAVAGNSIELRFWYAGLLLFPHPNLNTISKQYVTIVATTIYTLSTGTGEVNFYRRGKAFIDNETFSNTDAIYNFTCTNGTIPTKQWAKNFEIKQNGIIQGQARNLSIATGSYALLHPITIANTGGRNKWLPVAHYGVPEQSAYTILMRN
jgi:hypothetical protein